MEPALWRNCSLPVRKLCLFLMVVAPDGVYPFLKLGDMSAETN